MDKTLQQVMDEMQAAIVEFDRVTKGLFKPCQEQQCISDEPTAKIIWLNDYRGILH